MPDVILLFQANMSNKPDDNKIPVIEAGDLDLGRIWTPFQDSEVEN